MQIIDVFLELFFRGLRGEIHAHSFIQIRVTCAIYNLTVMQGVHLISPLPFRVWASSESDSELCMASCGWQGYIFREYVTMVAVLAFLSCQKGSMIRATSLQWQRPPFGASDVMPDLRFP
jgi:hypothetical protein